MQPIKVWRTRLTLALGVVALLLCLALPPLFDNLSAQGQRAIAVTILTVVLWTSNVLDSGATSITAIVLLALTGAAPSLRAALHGFVNPVPYFLMGVLAMGLAVARSGLAERLARRILAHARPSMVEPARRGSHRTLRASARVRRSS